jgi:hypothetical protein
VVVVALLSRIEEVRAWLIARPRLLGEVTRPEHRALIEKYKRSLARAIGVPPEAIRDDVAERWLIHWLRALVKPEYWKMLGIE